MPNDGRSQIGLNNWALPLGCPKSGDLLFVRKDIYLPIFDVESGDPGVTGVVSI